LHSKSLLSRAFFRNTFFLSIFCKSFFILLFFSPPLYGENLSFSITKTSGTTPLLVKTENLSLAEYSKGEILSESLTILTGTNSTAEIKVLLNGQTLSSVFINPGTDLIINFTESLQLASNYGSFRIVTSGLSNDTIISGNKYSLKLPPSSDMQLSQLIDSKTYLFTTTAASFKSSILITENTDKKKFLLPEMKKGFFSEKRSDINEISIKELASYKTDFSFKETPEDTFIIYFLENAGIDKNIQENPAAAYAYRPNTSVKRNIIYFPIEDKEEEILIEEKEEKIVEKKVIEYSPELIKSYLLDLPAFETGFAYSNKEMGIRTGWFPEISISDNLFFMSLNFDFHIVPVNIQNNISPFYKINKTNNEWSFGSDYLNNIPAMIFDIIEDASLKTGFIKYGLEKSPFTLQSGNTPVKNDFASLRYFDYSPNLLMPYYRTTSFDISYRLPFFEGSFYAENVAVGGLFDISVKLMTPYENFKISGETSITTDTYDIRKGAGQNNYKALTPLNFDNNIRFVIFNLPSFGYELYGNLGILFPFTINTKDFSSDYLSVFEKSPESILRFINVSIGQMWRFYNFSISADPFLNSRFAGITQYSPTYFLSRHSYFSELRNWYNDKSSENSSLLSDYIFGTRLGMKYNARNQFIFKLFYIPGINYDLKTISYIDRFLLSISASNKPDKPVSVIFSLTVDWNNPVMSIYNSAVKADYNNIFNGLLLAADIEFRFTGQVYTGGSFIMTPRKQ
jgi:hypothetical protein